MDLIFLIKSIMNKKLFSWKALAGLALLVAMGLTSCKQDTVVDPNDPYNTTKPTKPSSSLDGDYDGEVTIAKTSDFADQWKSVATKVQKAVAEADGIDIKINCGAYALDGKTIEIPTIWANAEGKIVNIVFSGAFKSKADADGNTMGLDVNTDNVAGAEVNIYLPTDEFNFNLAATKVKPTLYGESTILDLFSAQANTNKKNGMTIGDGVQVNVITMAGALLGTDNVEALLVNGNISLKEGKGAQVGNQEVYVKNLFVVADATVSGADKAALETVTVIDNTTLTLGSAKSEIESIVGLGTAKKPTKLVMKGDADDFSKIGAVTNFIISGHKLDAVTGDVISTNIDDIDIFTNVVFDMDVTIAESASDTEFDGNVIVKVDDSATIKFTSVEFGKKANVAITGGSEVKGKQTVINMFQWAKGTASYEPVKDMDEDNLTAANAKSEGVDITQRLWNRTTGNWCDSWEELVTKNNNISWDGTKFACVPVDAAKEALNNTAKTGSEQVYKQLVADKGAAVANADPALAQYKADWEKLYGKCKKVETEDKDGKAISVKFTACTDKEIYDGYYMDGTTKVYISNNRTWNGDLRYYADENDFVTSANKKIDGCDWFTVYFQGASETVEPEDITIAFTDCTLAGKALTVTKLNDLINWWPGFTSAKEAWFKVLLDGEALTWKNTTGGFVLQ